MAGRGEQHVFVIEVIITERVDVDVAYFFVADIFQTHQSAIGLGGDKELVPANDFNCVSHIDVFFCAVGLAGDIVVNILFDRELFYAIQPRDRLASLINRYRQNFQ